MNLSFQAVLFFIVFDIEFKNATTTELRPIRDVPLLAQRIKQDASTAISSIERFLT